MDSYCETRFFNDFMRFYDSSGEYDLSIIFDDFYQEFITRTTPDFLKTVYQYYYNIEEDENIDEEAMFQTLYSQIEKFICDKCESEADTDTDE